MWQEFDFPRDGWNLHGVRGPRNGPPLVFLHGVMRRWQTFLPLMPALSSRHEVWSLDLRGHGNSRGPDEGYHVVDYVPDIVALLKTEASEPAILYGHSLGGMLAALVAATAPDCVRGAIVEDPPFHTMGDRIHEAEWQNFFAGLQQFAGSTAPVDVLKNQLGDYTWHDKKSEANYRMGDKRDAATLRFFAWCYKQLRSSVLDPLIEGTWLDGYNVGDVFHRIECPVLMLQADPAAGGTLTDADVELALERIRDVNVMRFPGVGHSIHTARTAEVVNAVSIFCETLR